MRRLLIILAAAALSLTAAAQNVTDLIISEVMADGDSSVLDDYGRRGGWIEIFNKSQGTVNLAGCYLTDDESNLKKSIIPKGDLRVQLGPRQSMIFYASGNGDDGTFYTDFTITRGSTILLISNDGRTIVDRITVPADLPSGMSVSKIALDNKEMDFQVSAEPTVPTPGFKSGSLSVESNPQKMARIDPHGITLTIVSVSVVFCALAILWFLFNLLFKPREKKEKKPAAKGKAADDEVAVAIALALQAHLGGADGETAAAIAMALELYERSAIHDSESFVITIKPTANSLWADKSLTFRRRPR